MWNTVYHFEDPWIETKKHRKFFLTTLSFLGSNIKHSKHLNSSTQGIKSMRFCLTFSNSFLCNHVKNTNQSAQWHKSLWAFLWVCCPSYLSLLCEFTHLWAQPSSLILAFLTWAITKELRGENMIYWKQGRKLQRLMVQWLFVVWKTPKWYTWEKPWKVILSFLFFRFFFPPVSVTKNGE